MHEHFRVVAMPVTAAEQLDGIETEVLSGLDPPLNLDRMPRISVRAQLSELRRRYSRKVRGASR